MSRAGASCLLALVLAGCRFLAGDESATPGLTPSAGVLSTVDPAASPSPVSSAAPQASPSTQATSVPTATPDETPAPSQTPAASQTPLVTPTPGGLRLDSLNWRSFTEPFDGTSNDDVSGLFINPAGELVAWGTSQRGSDATFDYTTAFWATSDNGETWRENRLDGPGDWLSVRDVAISGDDFVAVADQGGYGPGAWWSDDGFTWAAASVTPEAPPPLVDYMIAVAAGAEGYLAVGGAGGDDNTRLAGWFSTTGKEWTRLDIDLGPGWFEDVVASPDGGFVAVGTDWSGASATDEIWLVSSDGQDWEPAKPLDKTAGPGEDHIGDLLTFDGGYLAFGMHAEAGEPVSCKGCPWDPERWRIYTSPDGQTWDRHEIGGIGQAMPRLPWYRAVQAWQDGLIAVGSDSENNYRVWTSTDGVTWEAIGAPFGSPMDRSYFTVLVDDHRIVTAGMGEYGGLVTVGTTSP